MKEIELATSRYEFDPYYMNMPGEVPILQNDTGRVNLSTTSKLLFSNNDHLSMGRSIAITQCMENDKLSPIDLSARVNLDKIAPIENLETSHNESSVDISR